MQVDIRRHVLRFLFTMRLNFQLLVLSLTTLEAVHVMLISTAVYYHWVENILLTVLGLANNRRITIFHLTLNFWVPANTVIIIDCRYKSILFSSVVIWCNGWLSSNYLTRCNLFIPILNIIFSKIITLTPWLTMSSRIVGQNLKLIWISRLLLISRLCLWTHSSSIIC